MLAAPSKHDPRPSTNRPPPQAGCGLCSSDVVQRQLSAAATGTGVGAGGAGKACSTGALRSQACWPDSSSAAILMTVPQRHALRGSSLMWQPACRGRPLFTGSLCGVLWCGGVQLVAIEKILCCRSCYLCCLCVESRLTIPLVVYTAWGMSWGCLCLWPRGVPRSVWLNFARGELGVCNVPGFQQQISNNFPCCSTMHYYVHRVCCVSGLMACACVSGGGSAGPTWGWWGQGGLLVGGLGCRLLAWR